MKRRTLKSRRRIESLRRACRYRRLRLEALEVRNLLATDSNPSDIHTATIHWGDGNVTAGSVGQATDTVTGSHVYHNGGPSIVHVQASRRRAHPQIL